MQPLAAGHLSPNQILLYSESKRISLPPSDIQGILYRIQIYLAQVKVSLDTTEGRMGRP